jgi:hypothetical protein
MTDECVDVFSGTGFSARRVKQLRNEGYLQQLLNAGWKWDSDDPATRTLVHPDDSAMNIQYDQHTHDMLFSTMWRAEFKKMIYQSEEP